MKYVLLVLTLFFVSCRPQYIKQGLKDINNLENQLTHIEKTLLKVDTNQIKTFYDEHLKLLSEIKKLDINEKQDNEWETLTLFGQIKKPVKNYVNNMPDYYKNLAFSKQQISNLKHDLKNKLITEAQFKEYFQQEKQAIDELKEEVESSIQQVLERIALSDSLKPEILKIIEKYKK